MAIPWHSNLRKRLVKTLNLILIKLFPPVNKNKNLSANDIQRVLIVRLNYRIGNILFLTPLIRSLAKKLPEAKIDILIGHKNSICLLEKLPNVNMVYAFERKTLKNPIKLIQYIKKLNRNKYDLLINPIENSFGAKIATMLIKSKYKLGFYSPKIWNPLTHTVSLSNQKHEALKPLSLLKVFNLKDENENLLDINLSEDEKSYGKNELQKIIGKNESNMKIVGIFRDARNDKRLDNSWWRNMIKHIVNKNNNIIFIDILTPNHAVLSKNITSYSNKNLRDLAKFLSAIDYFISADTGPMHLATASCVRTIGLFNVTSPEHYGVLGYENISINVNESDCLDQIVDQITF